MRKTVKDTVNGGLKMGWNEIPTRQDTVDKTKSGGLPIAGCSATMLCIASADTEIEGLSDKMLSRTH